MKRLFTYSLMIVSLLLVNANAMAKAGSTGMDLASHAGAMDMQDHDHMAMMAEAPDEGKQACQNGQGVCFHDCHDMLVSAIVLPVLTQWVQPQFRAEEVSFSKGRWSSNTVMPQGPPPKH